MKKIAKLNGSIKYHITIRCLPHFSPPYPFLVYEKRMMSSDFFTTGGSPLRSAALRAGDTALYEAKNFFRQSPATLTLIGFPITAE